MWKNLYGYTPRAAGADKFAVVGYNESSMIFGSDTFTEDSIFCFSPSTLQSSKIHITTAARQITSSIKSCTRNPIRQILVHFIGAPNPRVNAVSDLLFRELLLI